MHTGKLSEAALKRSVLRQLKRKSSDSTERYGADCAVLPLEKGLWPACAVSGVQPGFEERPEAAVTAVVNNLAAGGAKPEALSVQVLLPVSCEETVLKEGMRRIAEAASDYGMQVLCGHTEVTGAVTRPLYQITGIGSMEAANSRVKEYLEPDDTLILTKWIALAGTAALACRYEEELEKRFPLPLIDRAKEFETQMSVAREAGKAVEAGACALHDLSQGGIFGALWEMTQRAGVGLEADLKKIPVKQETIEICEYFDINPYNLYSAGALLIGTKQPEAVIAALLGAGIPAAVIGRATAGNDRIIRNGEDIRYLDRPRQDEWYRRFGG